MIKGKARKSYIAFTTLLVLSAIIFLAGVTLTLLSVFQIQQSLSQETGFAAHALAEGCAEDALLSSFNNSDYAGGSKVFPEGTCTISVSKVGNNWVLDVQAAISSRYKKRIRVNILRAGSVQVLSWREIE